MVFKGKKEKYEYEFLPAALEVEETPPSPFGRFIVWTIFVIIIIAVIWSIFARTDKVAVARGKIIPVGKAKVVEPLEEGVVKHIFVREGQKVKKGQLLVSLDSTENTSSVEELKKYLGTLKLEKYLLKKLLIKNNTVDLNPDVIFSVEKINSMKEFADLTRAEIDYHIELQTTRYNEFCEQEMMQKHILTQREADLSISKTMLSKMENRLKVLSAQEQMYKKLEEKGSVSEQVWIEKMSELDTLEHEIKAKEVEVQSAGYKIEETKKSISLTRRHWRTENLKELVETENKIRSTETQLKKESRRLNLRNLYSPVDGTVNQVEITTIGEVVTPAQGIISIVPDNMPKVAEVSVENKDIGFIHNGQKVEIKLDTFPFHKYGVVDGEVMNISPDAIVDQKTGMLTYEVYIKPLQDNIHTGNKIVKLVPGMTLTAEIKTGTRRVIEYFLDPIMTFKGEAFKQR